jgi:hypothetical protein
MGETEILDRAVAWEKKAPSPVVERWDGRRRRSGNGDECEDERWRTIDVER